MKISPLQLFEPKDFSGLVTDNHLGALWMEEPILISNMIENLYSVNVADDYLTFINRFPVKTVDDDLPIQWMLAGMDQKVIPLIAAYDATNTLITPSFQAGRNKSRFFMEFPEKYFFADHVIVGEKPDLYHVRLVDEPVQKGSHFVYEAELVTNDLTLFIPYEELVANTRWSISHSMTEQTLSKRGTGVHHTSPFRMEVEMSFFRKEYSVPGNMINKGKNKPLAFAFKDEKGVTQTMWIKKLDWDFLKEFRRDTANMLLYGKSNKLADGTYYNTGSSGFQMRTGMGLRDQIAPSNIMTYNTFDLDSFTDFLLGLSVNKLPEDKRKFVLATGEYGAIEFSKAVEANSRSIDTSHLAYGTTNRFSGSPQAATYSRGQFIKYVTYRGIEIEVVIMPQYDDIIRNKINMPGKMGRAESYRYTILDFGTSSGEPNIQRLVPKSGSEIYKYIPGLRDPFSPDNGINPGMTASRVDGYEIHRAFTGGIMVKNPMRLGEYIPAVIS